MRSLGFDSLVEAYDRTRTVDPASLSAALAEVQKRFPSKDFPVLLDAGVGTGRIAIPLLERGYRVLGVDISRSMLARFRRKELGSPHTSRTDLLLADVAAIPLRDHSVQLSLATHLFYFVADWRQAARELLRVTERRGAILLLHTGGGREVPEVRDRYRELCGELGFRPRSVGVHGVGVESTKEVLAFYRTQGLRVNARAGVWRWTERVPAAEAVADLEARSYSFTIAVPDSVHSAAISKLRQEVATSHLAPMFGFETENAISLSIVSWE